MRMDDLESTDLREWQTQRGAAGVDPRTFLCPPQPGTTLAGDLLTHVAGIVNGARNRTHGDKERSFAGIAKAWTRIFGVPFKGSDVARAMVALKEQRMRYGDQSPEAQREHVEDILGYWAIYYELKAAERGEGVEHG